MRRWRMITHITVFHFTWPTSSNSRRDCKVRGRRTYNWIAWQIQEDRSHPLGIRVAISVCEYYCRNHRSAALVVSPRKHSPPYCCIRSAARTPVPVCKENRHHPIHPNISSEKSWVRLQVLHRIYSGSIRIRLGYTNIHCRYVLFWIHCS